MTQYWRISLFAMMLASAGLPIYIHLPRFASVDLGINLATVGAIVLGIRIMDFVQDPIIGRIIDKWRGPRDRLALIGMSIMALGFVMLFSITPPINAAIWMTVSLILVFTGYSFGSILMYGESAALAGSGSESAQLRLATFRETGLIIGVIFAAMGPVILAGGFASFGWVLCGLIAVTYLFTRSLWQSTTAPTQDFDLARLIGAGGVWLLVLAVVNSLPVAMTSTLFLFFVEDSLQLTDWSGPFLIFFFVASGVAIPIWSKLAERFGARPVLLAAMCLSISSFVWAAMIQPGNALGFGIICFASGAAVGAELVILPAVFASLLSRAGVAPAQSFGLWSFATKLSLPIAAAATLPLLDQAGFVAGQVNSEAALDRLTLLYAVAPCALKIIACITLLSLPKRIFAGATTT